MTARPTGERFAVVGVAALRLTLLAVIFVSEQLVDARQLAETMFYIVLGVALASVLAPVLVLSTRVARPVNRWLARLQPALDVLLLAALAYTSGGAFSDVRKAFFVIPLAAAFSERKRTTAGWSLIAVVVFTIQAVAAGGHPAGARNDWQRLTLNQDLYLAWTGAAATVLAYALGRRTAVTADLARSRQRLVTHAIESVERERTRLAGALHDSPVQNLIAARHDLRRAERSGDPESFRRLHDAIDSTITELREEIFNLHPHVLDHVGLVAAIEQVARRYSQEGGPRVYVNADALSEPVHRHALFAIGRELIGNAAKHASANSIELCLRQAPGSVDMTVTDDGVGVGDERLRQALLSGHIGLATVQERVSALGGRFRIQARRGGGTTVTVSLPATSVRAHVSDRVTPLGTLGVSPI